jgi:uncharacterized protein YaaN involved in tellurite resistance
MSVAPADAERDVAIPPDAVARIETLVSSFVESLVTLDVRSDEYRRRVDEIDRIGDREIRVTSEMSHRLLDRPTRAAGGLSADGTPVAERLRELRRAVDGLNPGRDDLRSDPRKLLGVIPVGNRQQSYFRRYEKAQTHVKAIVGSLRDSSSELDMDNAAIAQEQTALSAQMETLRQYAYLAERLDTVLESRFLAIESQDPERARVLRDDVLFSVRQRRQAILTQLAVVVQGYAALHIVEANNRELARAVGNATTTTVAALQTAAMVEQALRLRQRASEQLAALQRAWDEVFAALDQIDTYQLRALEAMKVTVDELTQQVDRSHAELERLYDSQRPADATGPAVNALQLPRD